MNKLFLSLVILILLTLCVLYGCLEQKTENDYEILTEYDIKTLNSRFGFMHPDNFQDMTDLGIFWQRPHPGPFIWGEIEKNRGVFNWDGPAQGKPGIKYECTIQTIDPEDQELYYYIEWGDGTYEDWFGPYASGEEITANHTYEERGTYTIKAKARDEKHAESDWGTLIIKISRTKSLKLSRIILIGKISYLEKNEDGDIKFLPVKLLEYSNIVNQRRTLKILDETYGEYPCCGYIPRESFKGLVREKFIAIFWTF